MLFVKHGLKGSVEVYNENFWTPPPQTVTDTLVTVCSVTDCDRYFSAGFFATTDSDKENRHRGGGIPVVSS